MEAQSVCDLSPRAVIFDAFGTLYDLQSKRRPFAKLARACPNSRQVLEAAMTRPMELFDLDKEFTPASVDLESLQADLRLELECIRLFPDALEVFERLCEAGIKIGIASNLAKPYSEPLLDLLPVHAECAWSFEVGFLKPDSRIFSAICKKVDVPPSKAVMVGDTFSTDYLGATAYGMRAILLDRTGASSLTVPTIKTLGELVGLPGLSPKLR